ncbi:papain-like cysteine protease family protein [Dinghuibacter silviterrae]|uniref:Papain like cysteine protease AvrRpt2 n=1 Tax=Dinghuibacter silviterrae TaxID=1539049 RepID=A0A4R8DPY7_9BACT|nr:papain-like cysteine protease family protein [Dinghuibacter silviterrae]TDX00200.1 papain like cysteine protease AvrRpt2 [Dinghuibacter silviterrae]
MKKIVLLLCLAGLEYTSAVAQYPPPQYVGIPRNVFNFYAARQVEDEWCWAASIQMILNYYGVSITQADIAARTFGLDENGNIVNSGASPDVINANLNNWSIDHQGRRYVVRSSYVPGAPAPSDLLGWLSNRRPLLITYANETTSGHAIVLTGCSFYPTVAGPNIQSLIFRDPWPSDENVANAGRVEYPAPFAQDITGCWFVTVSYY